MARRMGLAFVVWIVCVLSCTESATGSFKFKTLLENLSSSVSDQTQAVQAKALFERVLPGNRAKEFDIVVDRKMRNANNGLDMATVTKGEDDSRLSVKASSGATAAWALGQYLKLYCRCHVSWDFRQLDLPKDLPEVDYTLRAQDAVRFYQNVCTYGYSFAWWQWPEWQEHIDWMALTGFNLVLAFSGQEYVWWETFAEFGMTEAELEKFFAGPAFLPWNRMGNLRGWGGPLGRDWIENDMKLQRQILARMVSLGMAPVTPGFNGIVPPEIVKEHPLVKHYQLGHWGNFGDKYTASYLLDVTSDLAKNISDTFLKNYEKVFIKSDFIAIDTFNEMTPPEESEEYLAEYAKEVSTAVERFNPKAIWVLQGWMFLESYWSEDRVKHILGSIPIGKVLMLDLASTTNPQYERLSSYFGQPFVFCMLHNYGGTMGLFGKAETVNTATYEAREKYESMVGTGMTPEGIHNSYVMYDLMSETTWRNESIADLGQWMGEYSVRRYGRQDGHVKQAWNVLLKSAYSCCGKMKGTDLPDDDTLSWGDGKKAFRFHGRGPLTVLPSLTVKRGLWYDDKDVLEAWDLMVAGIGRSNGTQKSGGDLAFEHDLVDVSRQAMTNGLFNIYAKAINAYKKENLELLKRVSKRFLTLVKDVDTLLQTCDNFLLGRWLEDAKSGARTEEQSQLREFNARNQLTLWGPHGEILDYAAKQWSGLVRDYYLPRWKLFFKTLKRNIRKGKKWNQKGFKRSFIRKIGIPFTLSDKSYNNTSTGDAVTVARRMHQKWRKIF